MINFGFRTSLGGNLIFFVSPGTDKILRISKLSIYIQNAPPKIFLEQFELCFYCTKDIGEVMKFHKLGNKSFETD